jgi:hypothetical protein
MTHSCCKTEQTTVLKVEFETSMLRKAWQTVDYGARLQKYTDQVGVPQMQRTEANQASECSNTREHANLFRLRKTLQMITREHCTLAPAF